MAYLFREPPFRAELKEFGVFLRTYLRQRTYDHFSRFERMKDALITPLYKQRGKYARTVLHAGVMGILFLAITFGPIVLQKVSAQEGAPDVLPTGVLTSLGEYNQVTTVQGREVAEYRGGEIIQHEVKDGETLDSIAKLYNLNKNTIIWLNKLEPSFPNLKRGQKLAILPVDGVLHKVKRGETIYSIAKRYGLDEAQAQAIVNYPFNSFANDETFALSVGQDLVIPDGRMPMEATLPGATFAQRLTPNAGTVSPTGQFVWPAQGRITQGYKFYHKAVDIANQGGGSIVAADAGRVIVAGWTDNTGYGNRVMIDHGNGFITLYGHMSVISVQVGQTVRRGDLLGQMGNTGRSTGTHLHFEIRSGGTGQDPLAFLK